MEKLTATKETSQAGIFETKNLEKAQAFVTGMIRRDQGIKGRVAPMTSNLIAEIIGDLDTFHYQEAKMFQLRVDTLEHRKAKHLQEYLKIQIIKKVAEL